jgi:predicted kinase
MAEGANLFAHLATADEEDSPAASTNMFAHLPAAEEGSFIPEALKGVAGGAVTAAGTALKGQAAAQELALADRREMLLTAGRYFDRIDAGKTIKQEEIADPDVFNYVNEYLALDPERRAAMKEGLAAAAKEHPTGDVTKSPLFQAGEATQKWSAEQFKAAEDYQNSLTRTFTEALGSMVTMAGTSLISRGAGIGVGIQMSVGEQVDMALQQGASKEDILQAANLAFFPGATEYAPLEVMFSKIPVGKWGKFADALIKVGTAYLVEGGQEAAQQKLQNDIARFTYNPDQKPWENVAQSGFIGGAVGGTVATAALPFTLGGERAAPPAPEGQPRPRYEPTPAGAQPADTVLPPEPGAPGAPAPVDIRPAVLDVEIIPADQAPPAPVLQTAPQTMVVNDPAYIDEDGVQQPAGPLHGMTVDVIKRGDIASEVRLRDRAGTVMRVGNALLTPTVQDVTKGAVKEALEPPEDERVASPRLTPADRTSPIPNDVIDDGKALLEVATGQPSTVTVATEVDGKLQLTQTKVSDLLARDRAQTQAVINQILQGVPSAPAVTAGPLAAPPTGVPEVAGTAAPTEAPAAVGAPTARAATDYSVDTEDNGIFPVRVVRSADGSVAIFDLSPDGAPVIKHNAAFSEGKSDTDLIAYSFEPLGYRGAKPTAKTSDIASDVAAPPADTALERATAEPEPAPIDDVSDDAHPRSEDTQSFEEFVAKSKAHLAEREARAEAIAEKGGSTRMEHKTREGQRALVGPDMAEPGKFRITRFDAKGPFGHTTFNTLKEAANEALRDGYVPVERPTAAEPPKQAALKDKIEANRGAAAPALAPKPETRPVKDDVAITASGRDVPVTYAVIEADDLIASQRDEGGTNPAYPAELQPRDRSRGTSDQQINKIAQNLKPELLDQNPNASDGAPIISEDGVVESGNGRVLAIRRAFSQGLATAKAYVDYLASKGYPVQGMRRPVLVRVRKGQLTDRAAFTREANERTTLAMSATERAMADAAALKPETVALYRGGEVSEAGNRDFVRSFMKSVVNPNEQAAMVTPEGGLSQEAIRRVQGALLAKAYGDADLVGSLLESTDTNIKAIGGALMDVAGPWAQMRDEAKSEAIDPDVDVTPAVLEAVRLVQRARNEGRPLSEFVAQKDIFSGSTISPEAEAVLRLMFRNTTSWTMPAGREKLADALRFYATEARKTTAGVDLLGETAPPATKILETAKARQYGAEEVQQKLPGGDRATGKDTGAPSQERAVKAESRPQAEGRPSPAPEAPAKPSKLKKKVSAKRAETAAMLARLPKNFNWKGGAGDFIYGYLTGSVGVRNVWQVRRRDTGEVVPAGRLENLSSASNAAQRMNEQAKATAAPDAKLTPAEAMKAAIRADGEKRAAAAKAQALAERQAAEAKAAEGAKFSRPGPVEDEPPPQKLGVVERHRRARTLKKLKTPEALAEVAAMNAVPVTSDEPGFWTPEWLDARRWNVKGAKVKLQETLEYLYGVAHGLATKEINEGIDKHNAKVRETGRGQLLDHVKPYRVENNHLAIVLQGPPASGKSTAANDLAYEFNAAITDVDEAKKVIPGYVAPDSKGKMTPGMGANAVHNESRLLGDLVTDRLVAEGANLIIPTVGDKHGSIEWWRTMLEKHGYTVHLAVLDVTQETAARRMWKRFKETGRLINPDFFMKVVAAPPYIFEYAKSKGRFASYVKIRSNDHLHARVSETSGKAPLLALGARFVPGGKIGAARHIEPRGRGYRPPKIRPGAGTAARRAEVAAARAGASLLLPPTGRQETLITPAENITYTTTPAFKAKADAFLKSLRKILDGYGLKGVDLKVWEDILVRQGEDEFNVNGVYLHDLISLALQIGSKSVDIVEALHHEVMHAILELAATDNEKAILRRKSRKEWITDEIKQNYPQAQWVEEGITHAFVRWLQGERMDGMINRSFKKFKTFLKALYQALTGHDIRTAEDVFRQIQSGKIGGRTQVGAGIEFAPVAEPPAFFSKVEPKRENFPKNIRDRMNRADQELNAAVQEAMEEFTRWTPGGVRIEGGAMSPAVRQGQGQLERAARGDDPELLDKIRADVEPILEILRENYGPVVKLYRKQRQVAQGSRRAILSWSVSYDYAMSHMPAHKEGVPQEHTLLSAEVPLDSEHILAVTDRGGEGEFILINKPENQVFVDDTGKLVSGGRVNVGMFSKPLPSEIVDLFDGPAEQLVIPGAEKVSEKTLAQRRAEAPMRPSVGQKGVGELPLFGDEKNQMALFSKPINLGGDEKAAVKTRIDAALNEAYATLFPNPLNNAEVGFANEKQDAVIMMQLENYGDSLYVKWLSAYPQKSGMGTQGMNYLKELATKHDVPLSLTTWDRGNIGAKRLTKIYEKWGFKAGKQGLMWWHPAPKAEDVAKFSKPPSGPNDPRFSLVAAPHTTQQAAQVTQGFLNRGQPVDRAIRVPWSLFGGLDEQNRWIPSKRLDEKGHSTPARREGLAIGGIIGAGIGTFVGGPGVGTIAGFAAGGTVGATILGSTSWPTNGAFGFFRSFAENAKRGLITNYGLDPEYVQTFRKSELYKVMREREGAEILKVLHNAGVGTKEAEVIQQILSGEPVNDDAMKRLSGPIRKAIDDMGAEAVSLGLISAESFERNRGAYLHRVYAKTEADQGTMAGWVSGQMTSRRKKIIGDELKGRGIFMDQPVDRIMRDVESFQKGQRGAPVLGEKFRIIDEVSSAPDLTGGKPKEKVMRRVYLPANEAVPAKYQGANWVDRGTWEVRKEGKTTTLWRDYTKEERGKMGEIIDARYTIAKTFMLLANDIATGKFYHDVSVKEEWTQTKPPPDGTWKEGSEYNVMNGRYWEDPDIQWVKVPDTNIEKSGGKKKWGALAGKFVRAAIWRDLNELHLANNPGTWRALFRQWKANHTFRLPVVHMNNVMSNVMFMDMADVRAQDLVAGIREYFSSGTHYQEARDSGAFGADVVDQELRDKVLKPILDEITKQTTGSGVGNPLLNWAGIPFLGKARLVGIVIDKLWSWARIADNGMMKAYRAEDEIFRMALYMRRRSQGESPQAAAQNAREQFLDYDIRAPWVVALRNTLLPFVSYTYRAVPMIAHAIQLRPWKIAKYAAVAFSVNALSYMLDDWDDDDKKKKDGETRERAALRDEEQGYTWIGVPRMVRMPWRDQHGLPVFLDIRRWIPAGDVFDTTQGSSALPMPGPLQFGGPLMLAFEFALNKQAFTGKQITDDLTMNNAEKFTAVANWAWKAWAPPALWNPGSHYWTKVKNAIYGAKDTADNVYSVPQALLSSIGIKVKPVDVTNGIFWHYKDFQKVQEALKTELYSNAFDLHRGLISQEAHDKRAANIMEKFQNTFTGLRALQKLTAMPKKEPAQ